MRYGQPTNTLAYDASWLDVPPPLGNRQTYATLIPLCDDLLADLMQRQGIAGKVRSILLQDLSNPPGLEATAGALKMPARSMRRQLGLQGTTFQKVLDEARSQIAAKYLRTTAMTVEDIAAALGFSDAANFRQAFRRWTSRSPRDFRATPDMAAVPHLQGAAGQIQP
ncbi:helix-turn-helix transcriptional regulator [Oleomonas cavernae]|uniref:helix-turn-helix transcriptional regulator n=1 Tax=Oleomonas cavernae TaxID=2320859 RepID=UPI001F19D1CA|nr:AraC family transcriptional regulator [Oleomonas cavernae]